MWSKFKSKLKRNFVVRVFSVYEGIERHLLVSLVLLAIIEALGLASPYLIGLVLNGLASGEEFKTLVSLAGGIFALSLVQATFIYFKDIYEIKNMDYAMVRGAVVKTLDKITDLSVVQFQSEHSGLTQTVIDRGIDSVVNFSNVLVYNILPLAVRLLATVIFISWISPTIGLLSLVSILSWGLISWVINRHYWPKFKKIRDLNQELNKLLADILRNFSLIQSYAQEKRIIKEYSDEYDEMKDYSQNLWVRYLSFLYLPKNLLANVLTFLVLLIGLWEIHLGHYQAGQLVTILMLSIRLFGSLDPLTRMYRQLVQQVSSIKKYFIIMDLKPEVEVSASAFIPSIIKGQVDFKDVKYAYSDLPIFPKELEDEAQLEESEEKPETDLAALQDINFSIQPGERVALVGPSGAGKTTAIKLLMRFADPSSGTVEIDGRDLKDFDPLAYRSFLGTVDQEASLFDESLKYNLTFGLKEKEAEKITDKKLQQVLKMVRLEKLTNRLNAKIGEKGIKLSGGERQRVAIARALIKEPAILVLDEPTSNLDAANEFLLKQAIDEVSKNRTTIIIAHRLSTIRDADKIIVMDKGKVVAIGKHEELLKTSPLYQDLVRHQLMTS